MTGVLAVELIGDHAYEPYELEAIIAEAVAVAGTPKGWKNQRFVNQRLMADIEPRTGLWTLPGQLLQRLPRRVRAKVGIAKSENEVLDIMTATSSSSSPRARKPNW